ncbi:alpha/beta hydrolase family protein [Pseudomonas alliivorans]|nr:alpha/beta hydrolase family protein [Pseudomonas alliivorans]MEE4967589.1 alpha/beta hydrolase family protein [Pseudomonas alliivorans]MEE4987698.1 alpha/beta hydrolase family protein [Pseudomonas alliivorans]MEE4992738.1 alpha/beta hydrolase family protein [Pseudomonas alliivorans]MEE5008338.1 alpha/beta hydrolase family protein [Pseudomonas alliivorans]
MSHTIRAMFPALFLSLIVPCALPALAADAPKDAAKDAPVERAPLPSRAQEDAIALERQLPKEDQQQLQAGDESFLALWKPANTDEPKGAVIILPGAGESPDWPDVVGPLRRKFPNVGWSSLSVTLPDAQDNALMPREPDTATGAASAEKPKEAPKDAPAKDAAAEAEAQASADTAKAAADEERNKAQAERVFARIDSAIAFAQQNKAHSIVLLGHSSGAYWAMRYMSERPSPLVQKLVMVAAREPLDTPPSLLDMVPTLKVNTADFIYKNPPQQAATARLQASKREKGPGFTQIGLINIAGNAETEQEQLFRRVRGWVEAK